MIWYWVGDAFIQLSFNLNKILYFAKITQNIVTELLSRFISDTEQAMLLEWNNSQKANEGSNTAGYVTVARKRRAQ